jgi:hypothetical protein
MRILKREKIKPIVVCPGDSVVLYYDDMKGNKKVVLREEIISHSTFNMAAVFELDLDDCEELGLSEGLGGFFGKEPE